VATQADIAKKLGISQVAVSLALQGGNTRVSDDMRKRVIQTARDMGYRRHQSARSLASGRFFAAAFVQREQTNFMPFELVRGLQEALNATGMTMVFSRIPSEEIADEDVMPQVLQDMCVDGMLVHEAGTTPAWVMEMIRRHDIPAVWLNDKQAHDNVYPDEYDGATKAVRELVDLGHRHIAFCRFSLKWHHDKFVWERVRGVDPHYSHVDRGAAYKDVMKQAGLTPIFVDKVYDVPKEKTWAAWEPAGWDRVSVAREILAGDDRPTAVFAESQQSAGPWITAALSLGLRVPEDLSVIMVDKQESTDCGITISTWKQPWREVGFAGVDMLNEKIENGNQPVQSQAVPFHESAGQTVGPPPA
jgi:LacI family transcriptional regulator